MRSAFLDLYRYEGCDWLILYFSGFLTINSLEEATTLSAPTDWADEETVTRFVCIFQTANMDLKTTWERRTRMNNTCTTHVCKGVRGWCTPWHWTREVPSPSLSIFRGSDPPLESLVHGTPLWKIQNFPSGRLKLMKFWFIFQLHYFLTFIQHNFAKSQALFKNVQGYLSIYNSLVTPIHLHLYLPPWPPPNGGSDLWGGNLWGRSLKPQGAVGADFLRYHTGRPLPIMSEEVTPPPPSGSIYPWPHPLANLEPCVHTSVLSL